MAPISINPHFEEFFTLRKHSKTTRSYILSPIQSSICSERASAALPCCVCAAETQKTSCIVTDEEESLLGRGVSSHINSKGKSYSLVHQENSLKNNFRQIHGHYKAIHMETYIPL